MSSELNKLWAEIKKGSEKAFYTLYTLLFPALLRYVRQMIADLFFAESIVQDIFIKLWYDKDKLDIQGSIKTYLFRMAHNMAVNKLQHFSTSKNTIHRTVSEEEWQFIEDTYQVEDRMIEHMESNDTDLLIKQAIDNLPAKCGEVFRLSRYDGLDNQEIAEKLGISVNTVRAHIYHALEAIKAIILHD